MRPKTSWIYEQRSIISPVVHLEGKMKIAFDIFSLLDRMPREGSVHFINGKSLPATYQLKRQKDAFVWSRHELHQ